MWWLLALLWGVPLLSGATAADLARSIRETALDPEECYRVRELTIVKEDIRIYLTDGYLIFAKPVAGRRIAAVFTSEVEGGDAEIIVMPPNRGERRSLASYTGSPNMDEHLSYGVLLFTDDSYDAVVEQIRANPFDRKVPEMALLASDQWAGVLRNIASSFEARLALDLLSGTRSHEGFFAAALSGRKQGNFDVLYDPRVEEQVLVGAVSTRAERTFFDVWTSFEARPWRKGAPPPELEFTVRDYRIEATLEPDLNLRAVCRMKIVPGKAAEKVLPFDLTRAMRISSVTVDGQPAEVLQRESMRANLVRNTGNDLILVVPPAPLAPGREYAMEWQQEGRVIQDAGNQVYYVSARGNWYPSRGLQFASYDLTFRYPLDFDLVTAGQVIDEKIEGSWHVTRRHIATPVRLAGFNLGHYDKAKVTRGRYTVEVCANQTFEKALEARSRQAVIMVPPRSLWGRAQPSVVTLPPDPPVASSARMRLQELASEVGSALEFMAGRFGPPALSNLTVSPVPGTFGQGFPGLIYLSTLTYLKPQEKAVASLDPHQQVFFAELLQAHETAHQWWGNVVTSVGYHDDWLMEALANYSALLYVEKHKGARTFEMVLEEYRKNLLAKTEAGETVDAAGPIVLGPRLESSQAPGAWSNIIYGKGSWILHMLRRRTGDARFLEMLAELRRRYEWKAVSTDQFRALAAHYLPPKSQDPDLAVFFDQWVYGTGIPSLKLHYNVKGKEKSLRLEGTVTQSDVDQEFSVPVPIEIQFGKGKSIVHTVYTSGDPVAFSVPLRQPPVKVVLDPQWSVLRR